MDNTERTVCSVCASQRHSGLDAIKIHFVAPDGRERTPEEVEAWQRETDEPGICTQCGLPADIVAGACIPFDELTPRIVDPDNPCPDWDDSND